jgi:predicted nuclease of predicted toxin-antitoxin system
MNFLVDMNLSSDWADFLTGAGFTAVHWPDEGPPDATDHELMNWAAEREYVVLTADLDFPAILAGTAGQRPSVIVVSSDILTPDVLGSAVLAAIHKAKEELIAGAIVSVDPLRDDLRVLPLQDR